MSEPPPEGSTSQAPEGERPPPPQRRAGLGGIAAGLVLLLLGTAWLLATLGVDVPWGAALSSALILLGVLLLLTARTGRATGVLWIGVLLTAVLAVTATFPLRGGVGERTEQPETLTELRPEYHLAMGKMSIDLVHLGDALPEGVTQIEATVGIGELSVIVPDEVGVRVEGEVSAGQLIALGEEQDGFGVESVVESDGYTSSARRIVLEASVGAGRMEVRTG